MINVIRGGVSVWPTESDVPNDSERPPMEVALHAEHDGLPFLNTFFLIGPLTGELDGRLDGLGTSVHRQHHVVFEEGGYFLGEGPEPRVIKGPR